MSIENIYYSKSFKKNLLRLSSSDQEKAKKQLKLFIIDPFSPSLKTHKLKGELSGYWSFSVSYTIRILFEFIENQSVGFVDIGTHGIYK